MKIRKIFAVTALVAIAALVFTSFGVMADSTVVVTPADIGSGWYPADTRPPGTGTFENGPATPPLGSGSFELQTLTNPEKVQLLTDAYDGVALADIDGIGYSTYRDPASTGFIAGVNALNIRVDLDGNGTSDVYMVYEPYQDMGNAAVQTGTWQNWDAYREGTAKWWINTGAGGCGQGTPCTWATIVGLFPDATVREAPNCGPGGVIVPCPGSLGVNQGSFNSGIISNADALYVSVNGDRTTYDFELTLPDDDNDGVPDSADNCPGTAPGVEVGDTGCPVALSKDACKKDGWKTVFRLDGSPFKNQGDCIQYVNTGK